MENDDYSIFDRLSPDNVRKADALMRKSGGVIDAITAVIAVSFETIRGMDSVEFCRRFNELVANLPENTRDTTA